MKSLLFALLFLVPVTFMSFDNAGYAAKGNSSIVMPAEDCTYWITKSSKKRHNASCRYYKNSKGYCTEDKSVGTACKVCGG